MVKRYTAIGLISCALLLYEIAIVRVLSVVLWYHFAFLAVSLAMLGVGAPGVWFSLRPPRPGALPRVLLAAGLAIPLSIVAIFQLGGVVAGAGLEGPVGGVLSGPVLLVLVSVFLPLLALGSGICLLLLEAPGRRIGRMYGSDLLGATAGALVIVPLMHVIPTPHLIAGAGLLPLAAVALVEPRRRAAAAVLAAALGATLAWGAPFHLRYAKEFAGQETVFFEKWTPTARLTVIPNPFETAASAHMPSFGWGMGSKFDGRAAEEVFLVLDGSAATPITKLEGPVEALEHLFYDVTSVGYQIYSPATVCVIGAGGGRDILTALKAGAERVDAVELNPHIIDLVMGPYGAYTGHVYDLPGVNAIVSEGRSFLTHGSARYDVIQISLIDSWAATAAGAFALSENYLYTTEAMRLYWHRLSDGGVVSITRWMGGRRQAEMARLVLMAEHALELEGVAEPRRHLAVIQGGQVATLLVARQPLDPARLAALDRVCAARGFVRRWPLPDAPAAYSIVARMLTAGPGELEAMGLDLAPPTDDRPFFFQTVRVGGNVDPDLVARLSVNEHAVLLLRGLCVAVAALTGALYFLPFAAAGRVQRHAGFWRGSAYFSAIGLAFMFVEMPWIQRFILYLGHPSYATTVVLATVLLGAGLGSFAAARAPYALVHRWRWTVPAAVLLASLAISPVFGATLGWPFPLRVGVSVALLLPPAFGMGFPFPTGMLAFGDPNKAWYWAMNGAASVLATVSSLVFAMMGGFSSVLAAGGAMYVVAMVLLPRSAKSDA